MKYSTFLTISALVVFLSCTKNKQEETQAALFARLDTEISQNSKAYLTLKEATETIGHRLTGSENGAKAEEYTYLKFKEYGFEDVAYQTFEVKAWARGEVSLKIDGEEVKVVSLGHSPVSAKVNGASVDMGNGLEADYQKNPKAADGKIALVYIGILEGSEEGLTNLHRSEKTALAIKYGAKGVIIINQVDHGVLLTGTASVTGELIPIPAVCIGKEDGMALKKKLRVGSAAAIIEMNNKSDIIKARNVIATLKGNEFPDEIIVVGGHLDSWDLATGAIDNGIGSFAVMDIARAFKANGLNPKRTIKFVMFMGEEQGLLGSRYFVNQALREGSIESIKYMMNLDMSGNPIGMNAGGQLEDESFFLNLGAAIQQQDSIYKNDFSNSSDLHSDHQPFMLEGVPILSVHSNLDRSIYDCYHSYCDDFKLVNKEHITNMARFGTMMLYGLANAEKLPATKMDSETTKEFMIKNNLKEKLIIGNDWKWDE
ncbi:MAG: M20/M25/M40 family metallo-hydrolase [Flavobacteriales bacterium]|nr:MAG: M20/M25/M40 family metallo-hydrolase [Flavobacteriales bacterium]